MGAGWMIPFELTIPCPHNQPRGPVGDGPDVYALAACGRVTFSRTSNHLDFWSELPSYVRLH